MTTKTLNIVAISVSVVIIGGWGIYWNIQVQDVLELLEMAKLQ
jgi:hypothetical protein